MNIFFWILQILLAVHTVIGAVWKFSHSAAQTMPSLKAIPNGVWLVLIAFELLCALGLILPVFNKSLGILAPLAAVGIAAEMVLFSVVHVYSGAANNSPLFYWLTVVVVCAVIAYGRFVLKPF